MSQPLTLLQYLNQPNPRVIWSKNPKSKSSTRNELFEPPRKVRKWEEFNSMTVSKIFGKRMSESLHKSYDGLQDISVDSSLRASFDKISDENTLHKELAKVNQFVVLEALKCSSAELIEQEVEMLPGGKTKLTYAPTFKPDWGGRSNVHGNRNIVPGDTKTRYVWKTELMEGDLEDDGTPCRSGNLWPINQVLYYCIQSHSRYGYIYTDEELFVFRVRPNEEQKSPQTSAKELRETTTDNALVEYQSIPWENHDDDSGMTVNRALWTLHILAANNGLLDWEYEKLENEIVVQPDKVSRVQNDPPSEPTSQENVQTQSTVTDTIDSQNHDPLMHSFNSANAKSSFRITRSFTSKGSAKSRGRVTKRNTSFSKKRRQKATKN